MIVVGRYRTSVLVRALDGKLSLLLFDEIVSVVFDDRIRDIELPMDDNDEPLTI